MMDLAAPLPQLSDCDPWWVRAVLRSSSGTRQHNQWWGDLLVNPPTCVWWATQGRVYPSPPLEQMAWSWGLQSITFT